MNAQIGSLVGQFVVEIGVRQAWPYITLRSAAPATTVETRLYIDTAFRIEPGSHLYDDGDPHRAVGELLELNNRTVTDVERSESNELTLHFDCRERTLVVAGTGAAFTTGDIWWLGVA